MTITYQTIEWLLTFLLGLEAFQLELVWLIGLFLVTLVSNRGSGHFRVRASKELPVLFFAFLVYYLTLFIQSRASLTVFHIVRNFIGASLSFIIGAKISDGDEKKTNKLICIIAVSCFIHGLLNLVSTNTFSTASRSVRNIWTGGITTATLQGTYFTAGLALSAILVIYEKGKKRICGIVMLVITIWNCMATASRTALYLAVILFVTEYFLRKFQSNNRKGFIVVVVRALLGLAIIGLLLHFAYQANVLGVRSRFESSFLGIRLAGIDKELALPRDELWALGITNIIQHPFGYVKQHYAHNMWIDFGLNGGIIPFFLLILYSFSTISTCVKYVRRSTDNIREKHLVILTYLAFNINFMVEPIIDGVPFMFFMYCMINGAMVELVGSANSDQVIERGKQANI